MYQVMAPRNISVQMYESTAFPYVTNIVSSQSQEEMLKV